MQNNKERFSPWLFVSIALHALAIGTLFFFLLPPREKPDASKPKTTVSRERLNKVHDQLRKVSAARLRRKIETLKQIERELERVVEKKKEQYAAETEPLREKAVEEAKAAMERTLAAQERTIAGMESGVDPDNVGVAQFSEMVGRLPSPSKPVETLP